MHACSHSQHMPCQPWSADITLPQLSRTFSLSRTLPYTSHCLGWR